MNDRERRPSPPRPAGVPAAAVVRTLRVPPESAGMRVDVFLASQLRNTSRTRARAIVEASVFDLEGKKLRPNGRVRAEQHLALWRVPPDEADGASELPVLHEDPHLLVLDKPAGVAVHPTARHHSSTVVKLLEARRPGEWFSLIHRIDRDTSGVLLVGRSPAADRAFKRLIEDRSLAEAGTAPTRRPAPPVKKTYLAITWGEAPEGLIDLRLAPDLENPLRVKMRVVAEGGLESRTRITVLERRPGYSLVAAELLTGRQHQIRVHLAAVGCPVVGDKLYGPDDRLHARGADGELTEDDRRRLELPRHALHAHRYELPHAVTGEALVLTAPFPADLREFWESRARG